MQVNVRGSGVARRRAGACLLGVSVVLLVARAHADPTCVAIALQTDATVIAYEPPSSFTICRAGEVESDVVEGRPVYVELVPSPRAALFRFRVRGRATQPEPTGLREVAERVDGLHATLHALASSSETIAEASAAPPPASPLERSRALYLGMATPRFDEILASIGGQLEELPAEARMLSRWCGEFARASDTSALLAPELLALCNDGRTAPSSVEKEAGALVGDVEGFRVARNAARDAIVEARASASDEAAQTRAVASLDQARRKASELVEQAGRVAEGAAALTSEALLLREAGRGSIGALVPGVPYSLTRFSRGGVGALQIDAAPINFSPRIEDASAKSRASDESSQVFRFPVVALHFVDIEAGIAATGGTPLVPTEGPGNVILGESLDGIAGLALVEFEPARFLWPDRPLAGLVRFPVIGVPFTRDPTRSFFAGVGLGWTEVGSISVGPYLVRELSLKDGASIGETLAPNVPLASVAGPELRFGYFVSASVDLLGLAHLFFTPRQPTLDATTGAEAR